MMYQTFKIVFPDLGWYEVKARNKGEAAAIATVAAARFHPELTIDKLKIENVEVLPNG